MVERFAPPSVLVSPDDRVVHLSENAGRYLVHPGGEVTNTIYRLVRKELRMEVRTLVRTVRESRQPARGEPTLVRFNGESAEVVLHVRPLPDPDDDKFVLVIFDEGVRSQSSFPRVPEVGEENGPLQQSNMEAAAARHRLQVLIEEYETSQEEMRAANEELQSMNEELRSTMEELETSKEELQSMNEELQTVAQENRHKVEELAQLSNDLQNLLASTDIATLFLDRELRILRFTPRIQDLFNVRSSDRGRSLSDLSHRLGTGDIPAMARTVLQSGAPIEKEVRDETDRWYLTRILPYKGSDAHTDGVVVTFVDITRRKQAEDSVRSLAADLEARVEDRTREVRELAATLSSAEQRERRRISQLLHDDLQQLLYGVHMKLQTARQIASRIDHPEALLQQTDSALGLISDAITKSRQLSVDLSPPVLEGEGLVEAIKWLQRQMRDLHGLEVDVQGDGALNTVPPDQVSLLFQVVRELLFNVAKHSGASTALVELGRSDGRIQITVSDEGGGFEPSKLRWTSDSITGFGLFSARERLRMQGGDLEVRSKPGKGTSVAAYVPLLTG
jgi:two-component system CheB/CheR fusion protein